MQQTARACRSKLGTWLALVTVVAFALSGPTLPCVQAAPQAPQAGPNQPALVSPTNGSTGVATPPTLSVNVTDPESNPMTAAPDFMFVFIPDPQNLNSTVFNSQTTWIVNNKTANNIVFVTTAGDMVNTSNSTTEYAKADAAIDILDSGGVWYTVAPGNHDYPGYSSPLRYGDYFGVSRYADYEVADGKWFGGSYDTYNTYSLFSASGMDFILINLQYNPSTAILNWAEGLMNTYSTRRAIVESHSILNVNNSFTSEGNIIYPALRDHDNLFLMLCGHMHTGSDGAAYVAGTGTGGAGQTIHIVQADYQDMNAGYLRLLRFSPANDIIYMTTYSPNTGGSITTDPDQKNLAYDMPDTPAMCYPLTLSHGGSGSTPAASPAKSTACSTDGQYVAGEAIALSGAVPDAGWEISGWTGTSNNGSIAGTNSLAMPTGAHAAGVTYTQIEYALTVNKVGNGTVTSDRPAPYYYNDAVQLTSTADPGWVFTGWSGDCTGLNACAVTMNGDRTVTATFVPMAVPEAPVITSITQDEGNVRLTWGAVTVDMNNNGTTVDAYRVYGSQEPYFTAGTLLPPTSAATTFTHTGGATGTTSWYYLVRAHNSIGESANSARRTGRFGFTLVPGTMP